MGNLELGVIVRLGDAPLIVARVHDRRVIRQALGKALTNAECRAAHSDPVGAHAARQEARMLRHLLTRVGSAIVDRPGLPSEIVM